MWLTWLENFHDQTEAIEKHCTGRSGGLQRYLPIEHFVFRRAREALEALTQRASH